MSGHADTKSNVNTDHLELAILQSVCFIIKNLFVWYQKTTGEMCFEFRINTGPSTEKKPSERHRSLCLKYIH